MGLGRAAAVVVVGMLLLAGCEDPAEGIEGALAGERFHVRSAIVGPPFQLDENSPPEGTARLVFTDDEDACDFERRRKEAQQRGEVLPRPAPFTMVDLALDSEPFPPQSIAGATYEAGESEGGLRLRALASRSKEPGGLGLAVATLSEGEVFIEELPLRPGTVTRGRLSLRFGAPLQGELSGGFSATYCEHL